MPSGGGNRKRKAAAPKTPLKQTRISAFFQKGEAKRPCPGMASSPEDTGSPDIILCTPPAGTEVKIGRRDTKGRKSLFQTDKGQSKKNEETKDRGAAKKNDETKDNKKNEETKGIGPAKKYEETKDKGAAKKNEETKDKGAAKKYEETKDIGKSLSSSKGTSPPKSPQSSFLKENSPNSQELSNKKQNSKRSSLFSYLNDETKDKGQPVSSAKGTSPPKSSFLKEKSPNSQELSNKKQNNKKSSLFSYLNEELPLTRNIQFDINKALVSPFKPNLEIPAENGFLMEKSSEKFVPKHKETMSNCLRNSENSTVSGMAENSLAKENSSFLSISNENSLSRNLFGCLNDPHEKVERMGGSNSLKSKESKLIDTFNGSNRQLTSPRKNKNRTDDLACSQKENVPESLKVEDFQDLVDSAFSESTPSSPPQLLKSPKKVLQNSNIDNYLDDCWSEDFFNLSPRKDSLDLSSCVRCIVVSCIPHGEHRNFEKVLNVKEKTSERTATCVLQDIWAFSINVNPGNDVSVLAVWTNNTWTIDNQGGFVCLYPDISVSSTALVGAIFCRRRGVLSDVFRGLDSDNKIMTIGSLVHEMLQKALKTEKCCEKDLLKIADELLTPPYVLRMLYSCDMTVKETRLELNQFIPYIIQFLKTYVTKEEQATGKNFSGVITDILDIEEAVASSNLGIKGRIDATVQVRINGLSKIMPLELKTGRASFSNEHRSQVALYTMMMRDMGRNVDSGLLLYLREGVMEQLTPSHTEIRDLILLRNDFAQYLRKFDGDNLPEPIRMVNCCKKCPYNVVCSAYLPETHSIKALVPEVSPSHLDFFHKWTKLLLLEDLSDSAAKNDLRISSADLEGGCVRHKSEFKYRFKRTIAETCSLSPGSFVLVSSKTQPRTFRGRVVQLTDDHCSVVLEQELSTISGSFLIEGFQSSLLSRYMTNLGHLLEEPYEHLRKIVIDQEPAIFAEKLAKSTLSVPCLKILKTLNEDQRVAVLKMLTSENYMLIEGPPGTGKTQTISALIRVLTLLKQSVLLVGHSHTSVDNVLKRIPDVSFVRMGSLTSIDESIHSKTYVKLAEEAKTVEDIKAIMNCGVIASTCLGLDSDFVSKRQFDVCIVDESSQVLQPEALKALFTARKFVLLGDPAQLGPVVKNLQAKQQGMGVSIFERLQNKSSVVTLTLQYRMNDEIMNLANCFTYNGVLKHALEPSQWKYLQFEGSIKEQWIESILSSQPVVFVDTSNYLIGRLETFSCSNPMEAAIVEKLVTTLTSQGVSADTIGVITPFRAQIQILNKLLPFVEVNTVDQFQGRDKDVIIFSCTKQDRSGLEKAEHELLNDEKRLTVAITRAKAKLILVGDKETLNNYKTFNRLFKFLNVDNFLLLKDGCLDFSWPILDA